MAKRIAFPVLLLLMALSAAMRLPGLEFSPYWIADEGYNLNVAQNLLAGRFQMFALSNAFVQHPPLFYWLVGIGIQLFGMNILAIRVVTALCGILTTGFVYASGRQVSGERGGFFAGLVFAVWQLATLSNRWGDTYNLLMLVGSIALWSGLRSIELYRDDTTTNRSRGRFWLLLTALLAGLGPVCDVQGVYLLAWAGFLVLWLDRRPLTLAAGAVLAGLPLSIFLAWILSIVPERFLFDLTYNADRVNRGAVQIISWLIAYQGYLSVDYWIPLGLIGLFLLRRHRGVVLGLMVLMLLIILQVRNPNPFFRTAVPTLPIIALGLGALLDRSFGFLLVWLCDLWNQSPWARVRVLAAVRPLWTTLPVVVFLCGPLLVNTGFTAIGTMTNLPSDIDYALVTQPEHARAVAAYLNVHAQRNDVVLLSPQISWLVERRTAEILQSVAAQGRKAGFYPAGIPNHRWVYDPSYNGSDVRYAVLDDFWRKWVRDLGKASAEPLAESVQLAEIEAAWTPVFTAGEYTVYRKP